MTATLTAAQIAALAATAENPPADPWAETAPACVLADRKLWQAWQAGWNGGGRKRRQPAPRDAATLWRDAARAALRAATR